MVGRGGGPDRAAVPGRQRRRALHEASSTASAATPPARSPSSTSRTPSASSSCRSTCSGRITSQPLPAGPLLLRRHRRAADARRTTSTRSTARSASAAAARVGMAVEAVPAGRPRPSTSASTTTTATASSTSPASLHSGPDMAATGDPCHTWSHAIPVTASARIVAESDDRAPPGHAATSGIPTTDGVHRRPGVHDAEFETSASSTIGVATHEMAHALGEPDYYNTDGYTSMGTGDWDIMAGGSWFGNPPGSNPTGFNPASRVLPGLDDADDRPRGRARLHARAALEASRRPATRSAQANPNLVLVPDDVDRRSARPTRTGTRGPRTTSYGLVRRTARRATATSIEGYYLENASRMPVKAPVDPPGDDPRAVLRPQALRLGPDGLALRLLAPLATSYFGRQRRQQRPEPPADGRRSGTTTTTPRRSQLGLTRGEAERRRVERGDRHHVGHAPPQPVRPGRSTASEPQARRGHPVGSGPPLTPVRLRVHGRRQPGQLHDDGHDVVRRVGDCTLQLLDGPDGRGGRADRGRSTRGFGGRRDRRSSRSPSRAGGSPASATSPPAAPRAAPSTFEGPSGFDAKGTADTWLNETEEPTRLGVHQHPHRRRRRAVARLRRRRRRLHHPRHREPQRRTRTCRPASLGPAVRGHGRPRRR